MGYPVISFGLLNCSEFINGREGKGQGDRIENGWKHEGISATISWARDWSRASSSCPSPGNPHSPPNLLLNN